MTKKLKNKKQGKPTLFGYLWHEKFWVGGYISTEVVADIITIVSTLVVAECLTALTVEQFDLALKWLFLYTILRIVRRIIYWIGCKLIYESGSRLAFTIRKDLIDRTFKLQSKTFTSSSSGLFVTRVVEDSKETFDKINQIIEGVSYVFSGAITLIYIAFLNIWVGLIFIGSTVGLAVLELYRKKTTKKLGKIAKKSVEEITSLTTEIVRSEKDIKALNLERKLKSQSYDLFEDSKHKEIKREMTDAHLWNLRTLIVDIVMSCILVISIYSVAGGAMAAASMLFIFMNRESFHNMVWYCGNIFKQTTNCKICTDRMFEIFDEDKFPIEHFGDKKLDTCTGEIEFKDVCFSYEDTFAKDDEETEVGKKKTEKEEKQKEYIKIFENLNFKIPANKTVAFVGKSGSGKSTILSLMSKMYEADSGEVLIDGQDIKELNEDSIRENISLVNQFPYIFNTTIKNNLLLVKKDATDEEILDACKRAAFLPFVESLKKGINTKVGEGGIKLSGGQKQRLAIARALLRKSKIILFDESTSSLDNFAQAEIKDSISQLSGGNTVVIVAHRLSTIKNADKIFFIDSGKICGEGTFEELYANNEMFRKMFQTENI